MLKSYEYAEGAFLKAAADSKLLAEERAIAERFVREHNHNNIEIIPICPACGRHDEIKGVFMEIFGIKYYRCSSCASIFAAVNPEFTYAYARYAPLLEFKRSNRFQSVAKERETIWDEFLFWLNFRAARYLGRPDGLRVLDYESLFKRFSEMVEHAAFCGFYGRRSLLFGEKGNSNWQFDVAVYQDELPSVNDPLSVLRHIGRLLKNGGMLVMGTRVGSGFDVLALRDKNERIFPYKYAFLPSLKGIESLLNRAGFKVLEISTPGSLDVEYALANKDAVTDPFLNYLLNECDDFMLSDFQRFLQKSGLSSYARVVAMRYEENVSERNDG